MSLALVRPIAILTITAAAAQSQFPSAAADNRGEKRYKALDNRFIIGNRRERAEGGTNTEDPLFGRKFTLTRIPWSTTLTTDEYSRLQHLTPREETRGERLVNGNSRQMNDRNTEEVPRNVKQPQLFRRLTNSKSSKSGKWAALQESVFECLNAYPDPDVAPPELREALRQALLSGTLPICEVYYQCSAPEGSPVPVKARQSLAT